LSSLHKCFKGLREKFISTTRRACRCNCDRRKDAALHARNRKAQK
jgi:hypothetical protein